MDPEENKMPTVPKRMAGTAGSRAAEEKPGA
jgi:hypothetical protein